MSLMPTSRLVSDFKNNGQERLSSDDWLQSTSMINAKVEESQKLIEKCKHKLFLAIYNVGV